MKITWKIYRLKSKNCNFNNSNWIICNMLMNRKESGSRLSLRRQSKVFKNWQWNKQKLKRKKLSSWNKKHSKENVKSLSKDARRRIEERKESNRKKKESSRNKSNKSRSLKMRMKNSWKMHLNIISQVLCHKLLWNQVKKMLMTLSSLNYSIHIYLLKNKENFTWSHCQHLLDRFSAPLREARVVLIEFGLNIVFRCHKAIDICLQVKREEWIQLVITWLPLINRNSRKMQMATLVK